MKISEDELMKFVIEKALGRVRQKDIDRRERKRDKERKKERKRERGRETEKERKRER